MDTVPTRESGPGSQDAGIATLIEAERITSLYELTQTPAVLGLVFSFFPPLFFWQELPRGLLLGWLAARVVVTSLRLLDLQAFTRHRPRPEQIGRWRSRFFLLLIADAASWGVMGWYFHTPQLPALDGITLAAVVGLGAIGLFSLGHVLRAQQLYSSIAFAPMLAYQLMQGSAAGLYAGLGLLVFLAVTWLESCRIEARSTELMRLRFEHARMAEQYQRAMQSAEASSSSKSRFVAVMSHEIRTPLNGILGMTQLLERSSLDTEQRGQLDIVRRSGQHLLTLVNDVLDLARIESGKLVVEAATMELRETVDDVCGLQAATARAKGLDFRLKVASGLPSHAHGDAARIKQVLHNLVGNAIKFTEHGSVTVDVSTVLDMRAGTLLRFEVQDTGEGIAPDQMERIFAPFEQAAGAKARRREGSGLGLSISREIARAMGGDLRCASTPGQGSVFEFSLPLQACEAPSLPSHVPMATAAEVQARFQGRVLLVDDNAVNLLVAATMLENCGLHVDTVDSGHEALSRLRTQSYQLVLMDCQMPELNGFDATQTWRAHEARSGLARTPIIALTASVVHSDRDRCLAVGMDDYLSKPFEMEALVRLVERYLPPAAPPSGAATSSAVSTAAAVPHPGFAPA